MFPIIVFSYVSFIQVSSNLKEQSIARLQSYAKTYGLGIIERASFLEADLDANSLITASSGSAYSKRLTEHFKSIAIVKDGKVIRTLFGNITPIPDSILSISSKQALQKTIIAFSKNDKSNSRIFLAKSIKHPDNSFGLIVGEADHLYLWSLGADNSLPAMTEAGIIDQTRQILYSSFNIPLEVLQKIKFDTTSLESRSLEYSAGGEDYLIVHWPLFLKSRFDGPNLIIILRNFKTDIFAPLAHFKVLFPLVALLSFWIVLLMSIISIRKNMIPLETLKAATLRLARRDFKTRVDVSSGDEFEDLANAFNTSIASLGRQFNAMEVMAYIDQSIHSSLNTKEIINISLNSIHKFFSCKSVSYSIIKANQPHVLHTFSCIPNKSGEIIEEDLILSKEDKHLYLKQQQFFVIDEQDCTPSFLSPAACTKARHFLILPLFQNNSLAGIMALGHSEPHQYTEDDLNYAKRLAHQVSTALSNARLMEELEQLNWGTLEALARTVDAKSKWTAGHSERVADLSVKIAKTMGCNDKEIKALQRASFLHDIGKIGIPPSILDKPGKLTPEEYNIIKEHPAIGAKILEPIESYTNIIPIVLQHHEYYNGKGYPQGLAGEQITLGARILSVADVYDALISDRPYREGWVKLNVVKLICDQSGKQFDPKVVEALIYTMS
ncbi:MAG: HD domain-containing protein [Nitrospirae bacterium]|nr:HD domain-containing protein [Nitrospirota bacterium]